MANKSFKIGIARILATTMSDGGSLASNKMTVELNPLYTFPLSDFPLVENALEETLGLVERMTVAMSSLQVTFNLDDDDDDDDEDDDDDVRTDRFEIFVSKSRHACLWINYMSDDSMHCRIDLDAKTLEVDNDDTESDHPLIQAIQSKCKQSLEEYMNDWVK